MSFLDSNQSNEKSSVKVAIRIRPSNVREIDYDIITDIRDTTVIITNPNDKKKKNFTYDYVYDMVTQQEDLYEDIGKNIINNAFKGYNCCVFAYGQTGCFAKSTPIMLIDGSYKPVEEINLKDVLMGDDSTKRNVVKLYKGVQNMYRVYSDNIGYTSYIVNEDHIMVFKTSLNKVVEMYIKDYIKLSNNEKERYFCYTTSVDFPYQRVETNPYVFGTMITKSNNILRIPQEYLKNSIQTRKQVLDGLIKNHKTLDKDIFLINDIKTILNSKIIKDIYYLVRSLGYYIEYHNDKIKIDLKMQCKFRPKIETLGKDNYYGFMLDGNHRFIGAGFNVLRNSGKTYSMMGDADSRGLIPRICENLFECQFNHNGVDQKECKISYRIEVSYLEIYSEQVKDLINPSIDSLKVRQHPDYGPYVEDLTQLLVEDYKSINFIINQGNRERHVASTLMNNRSSRSHAILTIYFTQVIEEIDINKTREIVSKINLVDLAGSERVEASGVTGINFRDAIMINKSLSTLGLVISKLASKTNTKPIKVSSKSEKLNRRKLIKKHQKISIPPSPSMGGVRYLNGGIKEQLGITSGLHRTNTSKKIIKKRSHKHGVVASANIRDHIPFRDSILTWILKESLGGNSKTYMLANISPSSINYNESLGTLRYAYNAKQIVNLVKINEDPNDKIIRVLKDEIKQLKNKLTLSGSNGSLNSMELSCLNDEIYQRQSLMKEKEKSWHQKLDESRKVNSEAQLQLKKEMALKQAEFRSKIQIMNDERENLLSEMELIKSSMSEKEIIQQQTIKKELSKAHNEYKKKQDDFEQCRIIETATSLQEYYEKRLKTMNEQYEQKLNIKSSENNKITINEINRLKESNYSLKNNLNNNQKDLQIQMRKFTNDRAVLSKQIQQLQSKIHTLEYNVRENDLKKTVIEPGTITVDMQLLAMEIQEKESEYNIIKTKRDDEERKYNTLQVDCHALNIRIENNKDTLNKLNTKHQTVMTAIDKSENQLTELKIDYSILQSKFEADRDEYNYLLVKKEELHTEITQLKVALDLHVSIAKDKLSNPTIDDLLQIQNGFDNIFMNIKKLEV
jgi:hypothetical protein